MEIINKRLTLHEFRDYIKGYYFGSLPANKLVIHHTWRPTRESWQGEQTIAGLKNYYEGKGWKVGSHLFIADDGIWLFTPMQKNGIHAGSLNLRSIGIEVVGNYNVEKWSGETKTNALGAIKVLMERLGLTENDLFFHRDVSSKSCPGWAITKEWLFKELTVFRLKPRIPTADSASLEALSAPTPVSPPSDSDEMVFIPVPAWAQEAVDFVVTHRLFKITSSEDIRDAVKFYRFYLLIRQTHG
ncbi:peptidoglycan recognition protein family protein [Patescibacteria group bacterium]|nr:peptidoglycan recognition protein family protein [Patescibacteria group bacterium]